MSSGVTADTNTSAAMKAGSSATATVLQRAIQEQAKHLGMDIEKDKEFFAGKGIVKLPKGRDNCSALGNHIM